MLKSLSWLVAVSFLGHFLLGPSAWQHKLWAAPIVLYYALCPLRPRGQLCEIIWQASFFYGLGLTVIGPWHRGGSLEYWLPLSLPLVLSRLIHQSTPGYSITSWAQSSNFRQWLTIVLSMVMLREDGPARLIFGPFLAWSLLGVIAPQVRPKWWVVCWRILFAIPLGITCWSGFQLCHFGGGCVVFQPMETAALFAQCIWPAVLLRALLWQDSWHSFRELCQDPTLKGPLLATFGILAVLFRQAHLGCSEIVLIAVIGMLAFSGIPKARCSGAWSACWLSGLVWWLGSQVAAADPQGAHTLKTLKTILSNNWPLLACGLPLLAPRQGHNNEGHRFVPLANSAMPPINIDNHPEEAEANLQRLKLVKSKLHLEIRP